MTEKRGPKGAPIRLGDDFNDDEATVLDVSVDAIQEKLAAAAAAAALAREEPAVKRAPPPSVADEDLEKTEMLERPDLDDLPLAAAPPRGVVPLGSDAARLLGRSGYAAGDTPKTDTYNALLSDDAETLLLSRPPSSLDDEGERHPRIEPEDVARANVRALDDVSLVEIDDVGDDKTLSRPKIARMTFRPGGGRPGVDEPDGALADTKKKPVASSLRSAPPPLRPLPPPAGLPKSRAPERRVPPAQVDTAAPTGTLVIEAPPGAAVFIDGSERGSGVVEVGDLDRFARFAVRVHRSGFKPWSRSVSLEGEEELRLTPELEPR